VSLPAGAIQTLLISDSLFRIKDVTKRKRYVGLVDSVKESGGEVRASPLRVRPLFCLGHSSPGGYTPVHCT